MRIRASLAAAPLAALAALVVSGSASAAPLQKGGLPGVGSAIEKVELVTQCWETPSGRRRCRTVYVNPQKYNNPNRFPVGSTAWWRAMDRNGSGGYRR